MGNSDVLSTTVHFGRQKEPELFVWANSVPKSQFSYIVRLAIKSFLQETAFKLPLYNEMPLTEANNVRKNFKVTKEDELVFNYMSEIPSRTRSHKVKEILKLYYNNHGNKSVEMINTLDVKNDNVKDTSIKYIVEKEGDKGIEKPLENIKNIEENILIKNNKDNEVSIDEVTEVNKKIIINGIELDPKDFESDFGDNLI